MDKHTTEIQTEVARKLSNIFDSHSSLTNPKESEDELRKSLNRTFRRINSKSANFIGDYELPMLKEAFNKLYRAWSEDNIRLGADIIPEQYKTHIAKDRRAKAEACMAVANAMLAHK